MYFSFPHSTLHNRTLMSSKTIFKSAELGVYIIDYLTIPLMLNNCAVSFSFWLLEIMPKLTASYKEDKCCEHDTFSNECSLNRF